MHEVTPIENNKPSQQCFYFRFVQGNPLLSDFESQIIVYRDLELEINSEPEIITVRAVALLTG